MEYAVALTEGQHEALMIHLLRKDGQEDLCFALYQPSTGGTRFTGIIKEIILPLPGERQVHVNVSFNPEYFDRVLDLALEKQCGVCFLHSHPTKGWQDMSSDDIQAETEMAPRIRAYSQLPLLGMTAGTDGTWSARFWIKDGPGKYGRYWCATTRVAGKKLSMSYDNRQLPPPLLEEQFARTISAWGPEKQQLIGRLHVGIVGCGSVGSVIAEALLKTGVRRITLIDFDTVELKNLDRLQGVGKKSIGRLKVYVVRERLLAQHLSRGVIIHAVPYSIVEEEGYRSALNCDLLFSCVDRPWPRFVLDAISQANHIPVIDGGIETSTKADQSNIDQARWKAHTCGPRRACMRCIGQYDVGDIGVEQAGLLDDPSYISNLPKDHFIHRGENVFVFSVSVGAMELQQFLSLLLQPRRQYYGPKEFDFNSGMIDEGFAFACEPGCDIASLLSGGDLVNMAFISRHKIAEEHRKAAKSKWQALFGYYFGKLRSMFK
jgi:hypothetical protein